MASRSWKRHTGSIAWPTIALFVLVALGTAAVWWFALTGQLALWAGGALQTGFAYLAFTVAHEAAHGNIHGKTRALKPFAEVAGWVSSAILFAPFPAFRVLHLQHHSHVNEAEADPDHWVASASATGVAARCFTIMPYYYYTLLVGPSSRTNSGRKVRRISVITLLALIATVAAAAIAGLGVEVLALWVLPAIAASGVLAFAFDWLPHHPHGTTERYHHTRVILAPGLPLLTMWQSYHLVHHLYPRVPFYRYGLCFDDLRPDLEEHGARIDQW